MKDRIKRFFAKLFYSIWTGTIRATEVRPATRTEITRTAPKTPLDIEREEQKVILRDPRQSGMIAASVARTEARTAQLRAEGKMVKIDRTPSRNFIRMRVVKIGEK